MAAASGIRQHESNVWKKEIACPGNTCCCTYTNTLIMQLEQPCTVLCRRLYSWFPLYDRMMLEYKAAGPLQQGPLAPAVTVATVSGEETLLHRFCYLLTDLSEILWLVRLNKTVKNGIKQSKLVEDNGMKMWPAGPGTSASHIWISGQMIDWLNLMPTKPNVDVQGQTQCYGRIIDITSDQLFKNAFFTSSSDW